MTSAALIAVVAAAVSAGVGFATRRREAVLGPDEAYLWYGTQRLLAGEQPVRDMRSYDPGRYWWCATFARVLGDGIVTIRLASHVAAGAALLLLGVALATAGANPAGLVAVPVAALGWRPNHFKLVDTAALALVAAAGVAVLQGWDGGAVALGATIGIAGVVGLNLGAYAVGAGVLLVLLGLADGSLDATAVPAVGGGVAIGVLPLLVWFLRHRGTARALWRTRVVVPMERGTTNLPLPIPWPWRPDRPVGGATTPTSARIVRVGFMGVPLAAAAIVMGSMTGWTEVTNAAALASVALPAFHHATSRADLHHLGLAAPFALGSLAVLPGALGLVAAAVTVAATVPIVVATHPRARRRRTPAAFARRTLGDDIVWLPLAMAQQLDAVRAALGHSDRLAAIPYGLPLLAALGLRSAVRDTFCVYPATPDADEEFRAELDAARPVVVLVDARPVSGMGELGFPSTHPVTWAWLEQVGSRLAVDEPLPATVSLWRVDGH